MDYPLEQQWASVLRDLETGETSLEAEVREWETAYSGLKNIDIVLKLANIKLAIALEILDILASGGIDGGTPSRGSLKEMAQKRSREAVGLMEDLLTANISLDQRGIVTASPLYAEAQGRLQELIMKGGSGYFEQKIQRARDAEELARIVTSSMRKYLKPDDNYRPLFKTRGGLPPIRELLRQFFSSPVSETPGPPEALPDGIEEGEELIYESERMRLPLSQAILYFEEEAIPELERELGESPGDADVQRQIAFARAKLDELKRLRFIPRSTPIVIEHGFYTEWFSGYTSDGELLVTVALPVKFGSGTNLERMQDLVQADIARRAAGRGICDELDRQRRYIKSLESGIRGSSRLPGSKMANKRYFRILKNRFPALGGLEDREEFKKLADMVRLRGRRRVQKLIVRNLLSEGGGQRLIK